MDSRIFFLAWKFLIALFPGWLAYFLFLFLSCSLSLFHCFFNNSRQSFFFFAAGQILVHFFLFLLKDSFRFYFVVGPLVHLFSFILIFFRIKRCLFFLLLLRYAFLGFFLLFHHFFSVSFNQKKALKK